MITETPPAPVQAQPIQPPPPYYYPYAQIEDDEIDLVALLMVLIRYGWLILSIVIITLLGAFIYAKGLPNYYKAKAVIFSPAKSGGSSYLSALNNLGMGGLLGADSTPIDIILKMINSRRMAKDIIRQFDLVTYYQGRVSKQAFSLIPGITQTDSLVLWTTLQHKGYLTPEGYTTSKVKAGITLPDIFSKYRSKIQSILAIATSASDVKPNNLISKIDPNDRASFILDSTIKTFQGSFSAEKDKSAFVTLTFEDRNPLLAAQIVNQCIANLDRINETLEITAQKPLVIVMDRGDVPTTKSKPNKKMIILIAGISSLLGSFFLVFMIDYLRGLLKK
jgi:uncharacterized protein involved in exopolysaccharide biosynthesis